MSMENRTAKRLVATALMTLLCVIAPGRASALPVFAHRFGFTCQACHTTVPHLNGFGQAFARNGFRLPRPTRGALPLAVKVNLAYSSDADAGGLPKAIVDEIELLTGGAVASHMNYFFEQYVIDGGRAGRTRDAWLQYNAGDATHIRLGQFTLPLPVDPETQRDTQAHYLLYDQTVGNNSFNFFDPRLGIEAYSSNEEGVGVHMALLTRGTVMAYAAQGAGRNVTLYAYRYQAAFYREGIGAREQSGKADFVEVLQRGYDAAADSRGGFAEFHYTFSPSLMAVARYDRIWDAIGGARRQTVFSLVARPARNMRFTLEDQV